METKMVKTKTREIPFLYNKILHGLYICNDKSAIEKNIESFFKIIVRPELNFQTGVTFAKFNDYCILSFLNNEGGSGQTLVHKDVDLEYIIRDKENMDHYQEALTLAKEIASANGEEGKMALQQRIIAFILSQS